MRRTTAVGSGTELGAASRLSFFLACMFATGSNGGDERHGEVTSDVEQRRRVLSQPNLSCDQRIGVTSPSKPHIQSFVAKRTEFSLYLG